MPKALSPEDLAQFRDRLCDAAETLFAEHGPEAVTMRQLALDLGVSPMTPYRYFKDKDAILAAVRARAFNRHAEALESAFAAADPSDPVAPAAAVGEAYVRFAFQHPQAYKLMFDVRQPNEGDYPELIEAAERSRATMTAHLQALIDAGRLKGDRDLIGHVYWAAIHGPIMLHYSGMLHGFSATQLIGELMGILNRHFFGEA
ncbi:MAG TPA: TetR/AcrR family transcriptional regulator [Caulobacteraceae bacterium]|nr:TetR/AcrR family transcriptional regulator [Caulobacteraceae bacterium]